LGRGLTRQALLFCGPGRIEQREEALELPPSDHVLVRVQVSAISAGTELLAFRGELPPDTQIDETLGALGQETFTYPFHYGYASVGEVIARGEGVDPAWIGRQVFSFQPHATAFLAPVDDVLVVPQGLDPERAVLFAHMETAVNLTLDGAPLLGEAVLVIGQGVVGLLTTALLRRFPLAALAAVETLAMRGQMARAFGADDVVTTLEDAQRILGPGGADLVYELSGRPEALDLAIGTAGHEARVVVGSWYGNKRSPIDLGGSFHRRRLRIISSQVSHIGAALSARWHRARRFETTWKLLAAIDTLRLVSHRFEFADAQAAYDLLDRHPEQTLQVLLTHPA
jgi:2-desacetyl-2-hydroxyethyl bacteriochlorophyllide A dehydrogenase